MSKQDNDKYNQMRAEYVKLAKRADLQLRRLEKLSQQPGYGDVLKFAYARAERDIAPYEYGKKYDNPRFYRNIPNRIDSLQARLIDVQAFLDSKSNTKSKIDKIYGKAAKTINEKYGTDLTWQDLANFYGSVTSDRLAKKFPGSETLIKAISAIKQKDITADNIKEYKKKDAIISDDKAVDAIAHRLLNTGKGYTVDRLFSGKVKRKK